MKPVSYRQINNVVGVLIFCIAATVYCLTVEPTASFWDCGEFILSAYKLEVGHPPGAPFFMLTANVFTQLTNDPAMAARMVNYMSALMSAATIWLLFLSITHLTRKLVSKDRMPTRLSEIVTIIASGVVGALAYTFSDTFWFSAVEGEVYAYSSLFTALVFWLILKWEDEPDRAYSDRWLILIAYLIGLSVGVHLLNLLCIPAIVLVHYYKSRPNPTFKGTILALLISAVLIVVILYGIIPGVVNVGGWFELLFVNQLGFPFHSGVAVYLILLTVALIWGIYYCYKRSKHVFSVVLICFTVFMAGFSSYALIMIRSTANTPMDQNSPEDIFTLEYYLGRKQYGQRPLIYGHSFLSEPNIKLENGVWMYDYKEGAPTYRQKIKETEGEKDRYINVGNSLQRVYAQNMLFPRMYDPSHADYYRQWVDIKGKEVIYNRADEQVRITVPTQAENLKFFFRYQLNFMYWRYFLWNFAGRQNDIQGNGELEYGNWITGIPFIDRLLVGDQKYIPTELKENKGRNVYYCLPLLLGIIGLLWQLKKGKAGQQSFLIVFMLFFMTGIAIILYLNQTPVQVRERDYAYAGSFYAFAIWIGMGVAGLIEMLKTKMSALTNAIVISILCLFIPIQMASQTWDDHDRSGRYSARDIGQNYLMSAPEGNHPVIFNMGDNDTFPLWYNQEVEGFRTDIRTCNAGYLNSEWYIDQMKRDYYDSPKLPIPWERTEYRRPESEAFRVRPELKQFIDEYYRTAPEKAKEEFGENPYEATNILRHWIRSKDAEMRVIPTDSMVIKLDKEAILRSGMKIPEALNGEIPDYMHLSLKGRNYVMRSELMMLETLIGCNWERPVYIAATVGADGRFCFENNLCQEGLLQRITPFDTTALGSRTDSEKTYNVLMNKFKWGGVETPGLYLDENSIRMYMSSRNLFAVLAEQLIKEGKEEMALKALDYCEEVIPHYNLPYDYRNGAIKMAECYYILGKKEKADEIMDYLGNKSVEYITWYNNMEKYFWSAVSRSCMYQLYLLNEVNKVMDKYQSELFDYYWERFEELYKWTEEGM